MIRQTSCNCQPIGLMINRPTVKSQPGLSDYFALEEDKRPHDDVLAAWRIGRRRRIDGGSVERPARDGTVGDRVIALEHRDLGRLLLREPVPLVIGAIGE